MKHMFYYIVHFMAVVLYHGTVIARYIVKATQRMVWTGDESPNDIVITPVDITPRELRKLRRRRRELHRVDVKLQKAIIGVGMYAVAVFAIAAFIAVVL